MKNVVAIILCFFCIGFVNGQNIAAYIAYNNNLDIFDNGNFNKAETNEVTEFYTGNAYVAYKSFDGKLKYYWRGNINDINEAAFVTKIFSTKGLFAYMMDRQLKVIDKGKDRTLSVWCENVVATDSLILYYDANQKQHYVYYNGDIYTIDDIYSYQSDLLSTDNSSTGKNIFLYVNSLKKLKVMYRGEFFTLTDYTPDVKFAAGADICVYSNPDQTTWKAYCNGLDYTLDAMLPLSYQLGNGMVAYIDNLNTFNVFYNKSKIELLSYAPVQYQVIDSIIYYNDNVNNWFVFFDGKSFRLENYVPAQIKVSNGNLAYIDNLGRLKLFRNGDSKIISYEQVTSFDLFGNVLRFTLGNNDVKIYWNGTTY